MEAVAERTFNARRTLHSVCVDAGLSGTVAARWLKSKKAPSLPTIGKLERALDKIESEQAEAA